MRFPRRRHDVLAAMSFFIARACPVRNTKYALDVQLLDHVLFKGVLIDFSLSPSEFFFFFFHICRLYTLLSSGSFHGCNGSILKFESVPLRADANVLCLINTFSS